MRRPVGPVLKASLHSLTIHFLEQLRENPRLEVKLSVDPPGRRGDWAGELGWRQLTRVAASERIRVASAESSEQVSGRDNHQ